MRIIELSNHPESELRKEKARREGTHAARLAEQEAQTAERLAAYETALRNRERQIAALERDAQWQRFRGRPVRAFRTWRRLRQARRAPAPDPPPPAPMLPLPRPTAREEMLTAGIEGERKAAAELRLMLDDDWTLLRGYRNARGEIDCVLLGPGGLFAIECKHVSVTVHCASDDWWSQKFDRWGNPRERGRLIDKTGRSPSQQLNDAATALERFLQRRQQQIGVVRIVLLTHERAACGTFDSPTVDLITTTTEDIVALTKAHPTEAFGPDRRARVEKLIIKDHRFHEQRSQRRTGDVDPRGHSTPLKR